MKKPKMKKNNVTIKLMIFAVLIILIAILILNAMARYESEGQTIGQIGVALYVLEADYQEMNLKLDTMIPSEEPYVYNFTVSNYKGEARTDIEIEYDLIIRTTTNLPLRYELYMNQPYSAADATNILTARPAEKDSDGTYFINHITETQFFGFSKDERNVYQLVIYYPETIRAEEYQNKIESIEIIINSRQVIEEEEG